MGGEGEEVDCLCGYGDFLSFLFAMLFALLNTLCCVRMVSLLIPKYLICWMVGVDYPSCAMDSILCVGRRA